MIFILCIRKCAQHSVNMLQHARANNGIILFKLKGYLGSTCSET